MLSIAIALTIGAQPAIPQTQTCPDGSVILASETCPTAPRPRPPVTQTCPDGSVILASARCAKTETFVCRAWLPNGGRPAAPLVAEWQLRVRDGTELTMTAGAGSIAGKLASVEGTLTAEAKMQAADGREFGLALVANPAVIGGKRGILILATTAAGAQMPYLCS